MAGAGCTMGGRLEGQEECGVRLFEVAVGKQRSPQGEGCKVWECRVSSVKFKV